jgi:hypothetical protein
MNGIRRTAMVPRMYIFILRLLRLVPIMAHRMVILSRPHILMAEAGATIATTAIHSTIISNTMVRIELLRMHFAHAVQVRE